MVVDNVPVFIEFNLNNGFFVADHSVEEVRQMIQFYKEQFNKRVGRFYRNAQSSETDLNFPA